MSSDDRGNFSARNLQGLNENLFYVLAVDDDPGILSIYRDILETFPQAKGLASDSDGEETCQPACFRVNCANQAEEAVKIIKQSLSVKVYYSTIFLDIHLPPGPSGIWAAEQILRLDPEVNIVLVTGYTPGEIGALPSSLGFSDRLLFLQKPFHPREIVQFASSLSAKWRAERKVRALNANLETLVFQKTAELRFSNEMLRREVDRRRRFQDELQQSLDRLRRMIGGTVLAIAKMVEKRDPYTSGHQRRVGELSRAIGNEMGLSAERLEGLFMASMIHDIGKISLPAEILSKPSHLNTMEWSLIQTHPQAGYEILQNIDFPWPVADIVLQHHERLNGSGYPRRLSGGAILEEARIVGVADVVETMSSHRPYRPSLGVKRALEEIASQRGILYDPRAVDACIALLEEDRFRFSDPVFA